MELYDHRPTESSQPSTGLQIVGAGLNADDLWRNLFWLRDRVERLEQRVRELHAQIVPTGVE